MIYDVVNWSCFVFFAVGAVGGWVVVFALLLDMKRWLGDRQRSRADQFEGGWNQ